VRNITPAPAGLAAEENVRPDRLQLIGLAGEGAALPVGSHLRLSGSKEATDGWITSGGPLSSTGQPVAIKTKANNSGNGEFQDRVDLVGNPTSSDRRVTRPDSSSGATVQWFNPNAFAAAPAGTYGTMQRNALYGPGFGTVDASLVKNTQLHEGISLQLRAEMFNLFNRLNLANPVGNIRNGQFGQSNDTIGDSNGAPGIGSGEPFNVQFAAKLIF